MLNFTTLKNRSARRTLTGVAWFLAGCLLTPTAAGAADYYVAPNGSSTNDGSESRPLDLETALSASSPARPGDTIWLRDGRYLGTFVSDLEGSATSPIVVRQYPGERAVIDAVTGDRHIPALYVRGSDTWYWGFEVTDSNPVRTVTGGYNPPRATSVWVLGPRTKFINMIVHDGEQGFGFWNPAVDAELYGNLIYNVGFDSDDRGHGHSIYVQNTSGTKRIVDNILFNGFSFGIHAYTEGSRIDYVHMEGNTIFNHGVLSDASGAKANLYMGGGDDPDFPVIQDNYLYYSPFESAGRNIDVRPSCNNGTVTGNYAAGGTAVSLYCVGTTVTNNFFAGRAELDSDYPSNTYTETQPTAPQVFVRPNTYEPGARGNITIFNWDQQPSVLVDLSAAGLPVGAEFEIRDAQNYFGGSVVAGVYTGESVLIPMTGLTVAPPVGQIPITPVHTAIEFGAFILLRTSGTVAPTGPTVTFTGSPGSIAVGQSATLSWSTGNATSVVINQGIGAVPTNDSRTVTPSATTTYTLTATNASGTVSRPVTIQVQNAAPIPPPGTGTASASFVRVDTTTQGNWKGSYGVEGYKLSYDATTLPSYAQVTINEDEWLWDGDNADPRALQRSVGSSRFAGTWYAWTNMTVEVGFTDGKSHQVALYAVDWDVLARAQQIEVLDATTGVVLDTRTGTNVGDGQYWVWDIAGRVRFRITNTGPWDVVVSGVFIDASDPSGSNHSVGSGTATFVRTDTTTQGTWKGVYGAEGYSLADDHTALPTYAELTLNGQSSWTWSGNETDLRALERAIESGRTASTWYGDSFDLDVKFTDGGTHQVSLYLLDWDDGGRAQMIDVIDVATGAVLDSRNLSSFSGGQYVVWLVAGHVRFRATRTDGWNAVVSGIFFDAH